MKNQIRNLLLTSTALIFIDQITKVIAKMTLSSVGEKKELISGVLSLYNVETRISLVYLGIKLLLGILLILFARRCIKRDIESKIFIYGLAFISIGFIARVFDIFNIGNIGNGFSGGLILHSVDPLYEVV